MNRYLLALGLGLAARLASPAVVRAADGHTTKGLALEQVVADVLARNPELALYQAEVQAARGGAQTAGTLANPELSVNMGRKRERERDDGLSGEGRTWSVSVSQTFEFPGRIALRKAIAGRKVNIAEAGLAQFKVALAARARTLGYRLLIAQELAAAAKEVAGRGQELVSVLVQRDPGGVAPLLETKIIEASVIKLKREATQAFSAAQAALVELNQLRGEPLAAGLVIARTDVALPVIPSAEELVAAAREGNLELRIQRDELESQGFQVALSKNERWPAVSVAPFYSEETARSDERTFGLGVSVPLPLWNRNSGAIDTATARQEQAAAALRLTERRVEKELREKAYAYTLQVRDIAALRPDTANQLRDAAELADRHYRLGAIPVSTYIELQEQYLEALEAILETRAEALENVHGLEVITGMRLVSPATTRPETKPASVKKGAKE